MDYKYYYSEDLSFIATVVLQGNITIERIVFHPQKQGVKGYFLSPKSEVERLQKLYVSDQLKVSPQLLSTKIAAIRHLQAETERGNGYGN